MSGNIEGILFNLQRVFIFARAWPCWVTSIPSRLSFWGVAPWLNPTTKMWSKERGAQTATPLPTVGVGLKRQSQMLHRCKTRKPRAKTSNQVRSPTKNDTVSQLFHRQSDVITMTSTVVLRRWGRSKGVWDFLSWGEVSKWHSLVALKVTIFILYLSWK